ncbi:MAG: cyclic nucleotide-binding domain-containing protein [Lentisphaerae bacterium]|nr:MAG: cyclic nucleotide-binding domain-containing protein [Lentisphaerota bacterium]
MAIKPGLLIDILVRMGYPLSTYPANQVLLREGTKGSTVFVLYSGEVSITQDYREIAVINDQGAMLGEIAALLGIERTATVTTTMPSELFMIEDLHDFLGENSPAAIALMKNMAQQIIERDRQHPGIYIGLKRLREKNRRKNPFG